MLSLTIRLSDVVVTQFRGENRVVLFLPFSGEVLLCSSNDWQQIAQDDLESPSELRAMLLKLGASIA